MAQVEEDLMGKGGVTAAEAYIELANEVKVPVRAKFNAHK